MVYWNEVMVFTKFNLNTVSIKYFLRLKMKSNLTVMQRSHILITIEDEQSACLVIVIIGLSNIVELLKILVWSPYSGMIWFDMFVPVIC